jgi:hypothetical protein
MASPAAADAATVFSSKMLRTSNPKDRGRDVSTPVQRADTLRGKTLPRTIVVNMLAVEATR